MVPGQEPYHWQRGLVHYYAGKYKAGRKQFEVHQTVNTQDVENAVWHYLCVAKTDGVAEAEKHFIKITSDRRVPLKQIHALFAGKEPSSRCSTRSRQATPPRRTRAQPILRPPLPWPLFRVAEQGGKGGQIHRAVSQGRRVARVHGPGGPRPSRVAPRKSQAPADPEGVEVARLAKRLAYFGGSTGASPSSLARIGSIAAAQTA